MKLAAMLAALCVLAACERGPSAAQLAHERRCNALSARITNLEMQLDELRIQDRQAVEFAEANARNDRGSSDDFAQGAGAYMQCSTWNMFGSQGDRQRCDRVLSQAFNATLALKSVRADQASENCL